MTNDKELIEQLAMEVASSFEVNTFAFLEPEEVTAFTTRFLARYLAERGKEAVAYVRRHPDGVLTAEYIEAELIEPVRKNSGAWLPLFLAPQTAIPEGWLPDGDNQIPSHISKAGADRLGQLGISVTFYEIDEAFRAMLAVIGVKP